MKKRSAGTKQVGLRRFNHAVLNANDSKPPIRSGLRAGNTCINRSADCLGLSVPPQSGALLRDSDEARWHRAFIPLLVTVGKWPSFGYHLDAWTTFRISFRNCRPKFSKVADCAIS